MKAVIKRIAAGALYLMNPRLGSRASILMYHSVGESAASFSVSTASFEMQMAYLASSNTRIATLSVLADAIRSERDIGGMVAVTFDDGYKDNFENAAPILEKHGISATFFCCDWEAWR